ncbi:MAG TPA: mycothiol conjugate amidase Mca [Mycobacteriales bacterium]|nr:mycothiol conjugate amidase Mca [Mycobacteriales bacterium]
MAVHAHPDDESSKGAATMARYSDEGVDVLVVTCTGGERGSILNPAMERPDVLERITEIRAAEMERAREILGVRQEWLGFVDSGLPEGDPLPPLPEGCFGLQPVDDAAGPLVAAIRRFRPHVVLTYDEKGGYPHPDHVMTHKISMVAFDAAGDPDRYPEAGEPWQPLKLYYHMTFTKARVLALHQAALDAGVESPFAEWLEHWKDADDMSDRVTTRVPCGDWFDRRDAALVAHATQVDPNGRWFATPLDLQRKAWPTEDYELVRSLVDAEIPEDDLFTGVQERIRA